MSNVGPLDGRNNLADVSDKGLAKSHLGLLWSGNGSIAVGLGAIGPTGAHTAPILWLALPNATGILRYVPLF